MYAYKKKTYTAENYDDIISLSRSGICT